MKPGALLLLVGSVALWTGLPAAPPRRTSGQPPLPPNSSPREAPQDKISQKQKPQGASEKDPSLDTRTQLGGAPVKPSSLGRPKLASQPALPNLETWNPVWDPSNVTTSGGKPNTGQKPASSTPGDKPMPGMGKATPTEKPLPGSGHTIHDKPKPASSAGHHVDPTSAEKPAPNGGPKAHGRPVAGEKPTTDEKLPSQVGHQKPPSADKPTSPEKLEEGEKPEAEKESKPEKEAEEGKNTEEEEEEEEGLFDDDDEEEEGEKGKENEGGTPEGNQDGDDAFDKELDYGLNKPPFDAYSYHDGWSDEGAAEADLGLVGEMAALPQAGDADNEGEPTFDAWGDLVGGSRP